MMAKDKKDLRIRIIGAGMGGLTCALALAKQGFRDIQVFESAPDLGFVGAGIQLAPNMSRILDRLGVWDDIEKEAVVLNETSIVRGQDGKELAHVDLRYIQETYGRPHMVGHRASLAGSIYQGCKRESPSIKFHFSTVATNVSQFEGTPTFTATWRPPRNSTAELNGSGVESSAEHPKEPYTVEADVLLACDGVKSKARVTMLNELGVSADVEDTGQAAYRIMLTREQMQHDPELLELINGDKVTRWIGEKRHLIAYPVSDKQIYNISTAQPDANFAAAPSETYTTRGSKSAMLEVYGDFCPTVQKMLQLVPEGEVCEWKLRVHSPLPTWVHGSVALVGDACHPTLPHLAQGAAQAIEDGAVLGVVLGELPDDNITPEAVNKALLVYEKVRKERADSLVALAAASGRTLHLSKDEAEKERDRQFAALKDGKGPVPDKWADADVQRMIYEHDCMKVAKETFAKEVVVA